MDTSVDPVDHLDGESVGGGHGGRRLLGPIAREAHGADGVVGEPFGEQVRLRPAELVAGRRAGGCRRGRRWRWCARA